MRPPIRRRALLLGLPLAGCAAPAPIRAPDAAADTDWSRAATLTVALDEYAFQPTDVTLRAGQPVRMRFVNEGARAHDFTSPAFFRTVAFQPGQPLAGIVLAAGGSVDVPAGETRELALVPLSAGTHEVDCRRPLHAVLGMTGRVVVTA